MHITTRPYSAPVAAQPYSPLALKHYDFLKQEIKNLLDAEIIHRSMSLWASPIIVVRKHIPEGSAQQFRLCIDYRKLNSLLPSVTPETGTKNGTFALMPLPKIGELFALLKAAKYFTALDLCSGYYYIKLDKESICKSAFTTVFGKFEFLRLPFGLSEGPYVIIQLIYDLFGLDKSSSKTQGSDYLAYLDDILIYSKIENEHLEMLNNVFKCLSKAGLEIELSKCSFF